jgi:mRNA-degrading endonuclease RelE of RelBE toxin-antitoxin system
MKLFLTPQAKKDYSKLPVPEQKKVVRKMNLLEGNPLIGKKLSGELGGLRCVRSWPYRIIYHIKQKNEIWVDHILHRQRAYK